MISVSLRHVASVLATVGAAAVTASFAAGCSAAPEQGKAEPIAIDQTLVCSAWTKGSGGDGCGGSSSGSSSGGTCGYEGEMCCNTLCYQPYDACINGTCQWSPPTLSQVTGSTGDTTAPDYGQCLIAQQPVAVPCALSTMHCSQGVLYMDNPNDPPLALWACESFTSTPNYQLVGTYHSACVGQTDAGFSLVEYTLEEAPLTCDGKYVANMTGSGPCRLPP